MKQNNLPHTDIQAFIYAVVKISQKYGLGISQREKSGSGFILFTTVMTGLSTFCSPGLTALSYLHAWVHSLTHPHTEHIYLHLVTICHLVLSTDYRDSPGPGPDIIKFPLLQSNYSRQTPASGLPGTRHSPFHTREDGQQTGGPQKGLGIATEFLV